MKPENVWICKECGHETMRHYEPMICGSCRSTDCFECKEDGE